MLYPSDPQGRANFSELSPIVGSARTHINQETLGCITHANAQFLVNRMKSTTHRIEKNYFIGSRPNPIKTRTPHLARRKSNVERCNLIPSPDWFIPGAHYGRSPVVFPVRPAFDGRRANRRAVVTLTLLRHAVRIFCRRFGNGNASQVSVK